MQALECLQEQASRNERDRLWRDYVSRVLGASKIFSEYMRELDEALHVTTREEIEAAEAVAMRTAAAFGLDR